MIPWLLFGAGGKGVGARTLELALAEQRPVVAVIRHADAATKLAQQGVQVFTGDACDASVVVYQSGQRLRFGRRYGKKRWRKAGCKPASLIMPFSALAVCLMVRQRAKHNGYKIRSVMVLLTVLMSPHISMNWQMRQHLTSRSTV